jgi:hypothetical protein
MPHFKTFLEESNPRRNFRSHLHSRNVMIGEPISSESLNFRLSANLDVISGRHLPPRLRKTLKR